MTSVRGSVRHQTFFSIVGLLLAVSMDPVASLRIQSDVFGWWDPLGLQSASGVNLLHIPLVNRERIPKIASFVFGTNCSGQNVDVSI